MLFLEDTIRLNRTMIKKLKSLAIFATVVDQGSFRAAAKRLGLAPSRVSETVKELEDSLGVTLLYRSTRRMSLTNEGRILFAKASDMMQAAEYGFDAIGRVSKDPVGELRVAAPAFLTQTELMDSIADFAKLYPKVSLKVHFSEHPSNLIEDGYDVAIRASREQDVRLSSHKLGVIERLLVASPDYFDSKVLPTRPKDLEEWDWVNFERRPDRIELIAANGRKSSVVGKSQIAVDSVHALYEFVVRGAGLSVLPENLARRGIQRNELIRVLPDWSVSPLQLQALWPDRLHHESLALIFVRFLA